MERAWAVLRAQVEALEQACDLAKAEADRSNQRVVAVESSYRAMVADAEASRSAVEAAKSSEEAVRNICTVLESELDVERATVAGLRADLETARDEVAKARAEAAEAAAAFKAAEGRAVASQGAVLRASMERLLFSDSFSATVAELAQLVSPFFVVNALKVAAADFPGLDVSRYSGPALDQDELNRRYASIVLRSPDASPLVKAFSEATSLLSEVDVAGLEVDRDPDMDAAAAAAREEMARKGKHSVPSESGGPELESGEVPGGGELGYISERSLRLIASLSDLDRFA